MLKQLSHTRFTILVDKHSLRVSYCDNDTMQSIAPLGSENKIEYKQPGYVCT